MEQTESSRSSKIADPDQDERVERYRNVCKQNVVSPAELARLRGDEWSSPIKGMTPLLEEQARDCSSPLPQETDEWLDSSEDKRRWLILKCNDPDEADIQCARILRDPRCTYSTKRGFCRIRELLRECNGAQLFGPGNKDSIVSRWSRCHILAISSISSSMPPAAVPYVADLLDERLQYKRLTIVAECDLSQEWMQSLQRRGADRDYLDQLYRLLIRGSMPKGRNITERHDAGDKEVR